MPQSDISLREVHPANNTRRDAPPLMRHIILLVIPPNIHIGKMRGLKAPWGVLLRPGHRFKILPNTPYNIRD